MGSDLEGKPACLLTDAAKHSSLYKLILEKASLQAEKFFEELHKENIRMPKGKTDKRNLRKS